MIASLSFFLSDDRHELCLRLTAGGRRLAASGNGVNVGPGRHPEVPERKPGQRKDRYA
jgi:hypothetical protein